MSAGRLGTKHNRQHLLNIGFVEFATWRMADQKILWDTTGYADDVVLSSLKISNALYAFCAGDDVLYIGKTVRSLKYRLTGYCSPGASQVTNQKCNALIRKRLANGERVDLYAFTPINLMKYGDFEINLAAGLEDSLIRELAPAWNGSKGGLALTESAALEISDSDAAADVPAAIELERPAQFQFHLKLSPTYFNFGYFNVGKAASAWLGEDREKLTLTSSDGNLAVARMINRRANANKSVRLVGNNSAVADWFQRNFSLGDTIKCDIVSAHEIVLHGPQFPTT